jgi:hypothetical protein
MTYFLPRNSFVTFGGSMRLRAQILVDLNAGNYIEAAEHQSLLQEFLKGLQDRYPRASLTIRERRERRGDAVVLVAEAGHARP